MRKLWSRGAFTALFALCLAGTAMAGASPKPAVTSAAKHDTSPVLRSLLPQANISPVLRRSLNPNASTPEAIREQEKLRRDGRLKSQQKRIIPLHKLPFTRQFRAFGAQPNQPDTVVQRTFGNATIPTPNVNFEGIGADGVAPPDTNGAAGLNYYVQMVNTEIAVWDKSGNQVMAPVPVSTIWTGFGGICENANSGDVIVLYDQLANRWLVSQLGIDSDSYDECVAISKTDDPTGAYYRYDFVISDTDLDDYPHFGVWPDGYYMSYNSFAGGAFFNGAGLVAFDRAAMLQGQDATMISFLLDPAVYPNAGGQLPSDLDGLTPPPEGTPNYFVQFGDDGSGSDSDELDIFAFHADFDNPELSTVTKLGELATAPFDANMCNFNRACIPQPDPGEGLDAISDRLMYRMTYRNFSDHDTLTLSYTVDSDGTDHAGIRWYEVRNPGSDDRAIYQQGTYAPDSENRWMGSLAMDHNGDMALGYSVASTDTFPSIRYTGRLASDPLGEMPQGEAEIVAGSGVQTGTSSRWGDYSSMAVDPADDCTFWYTQEYIAETGSFNWHTRVGSFKFPSCTAGPTGTLEGTVTSSTDGAISDARIVAGGIYSTVTDDSGHYTLVIPPGNYTVTASKFGFSTGTATDEVTEDGDTVQNFALTPAPQGTVSGTVSDGSGHDWPLYAKITVNNADVGEVTTEYTDPKTGHYSVQLPAGSAYTFKVDAIEPGYEEATDEVTPSAGGNTENIALSVLASCIAKGYATTGVSSGFEGGVPPEGWSVVDNAGTGVVWRNNDAWGEGNFTGGSGIAATVSSDDAGFVDYDTALVTPEISTAGLGSPVTLSYDANYQQYSSEALDLDISIDGGSTWTNVLHWNTDHGAFRGTPGEHVSVDLSSYIAGAESFQLRWRYYNPTGNFDWYAEIDNVLLGSCSPVPGGLVVGHTYNGATRRVVNGVTVTDDNGHDTQSMATPDDPDVQDGLYILFSGPPGDHELTASKSGYGADSDTVAVAADAVTGHRFDLPAALLSVLPNRLTIQVNAGQQTSKSLVLMNRGQRPATFHIAEINAPYSPNVANGPFAAPQLRTEAEAISEPDARDSSFPDMPAPSPSLPVGQVTLAYDTGLAAPYGTAYDLLADDFWTGNIGANGGDDQDYKFLPDGTNTGITIDTTPFVGVFESDLAYDALTGMLWQVDVGGDNCIHELNPATQAATGKTICPEFSTSQRGLAYDPSTDTFYSGSFNDGVIFHFDTDGTILDSKTVNLPVVGLSYNPSTHHLFVLLNNVHAGSADVFVLDPTQNYVIVGAFNFSDPETGNSVFADYEQAGMGIDCDGNLWANDYVTGTGYRAGTGESGVCDILDIPFLTEDPSDGTIPAHGYQRVIVTADASSLEPGTYNVQLRISNNTPSGAIPVPVQVIVSGGSE